MNIRDSELNSVHLGPMKDCWVTMGSPSDKQFTWDMSLNDNLDSMSNTNAKCRFDRVYFHTRKHQEGNDKFVLSAFDFVGVDRLDCGVFPSDHFGLMLDFKLNLT